MAISIIELPALIALLAASPSAAPATPHRCGAATLPSDFDCCIHIAAWDGQAAHPQHPSSSAQSVPSGERTSSDDEIR
jgi:hypothetical protein